LSVSATNKNGWLQHSNMTIFAGLRNSVLLIRATKFATGIANVFFLAGALEMLRPHAG